MKKQEQLLKEKHFLLFFFYFATKLKWFIQMRIYIFFTKMFCDTYDEKNKKQKIIETFRYEESEIYYCKETLIIMR